MTAAALPPRRLATTVVLDWRGQPFLLSLGWARDGRVRELFLQGAKTGSDLECLLDDACILASKLLQTGAGAGDLAASLGGPASVVAAALALAADIEARDADTVRETYALTEGRA